MNPISDLFSDLRIEGSVYFCDRLQPPWGFEHERENRAIFHLVRQGHCVLTIDEQRYELEVGDFVYVSPGVDHEVNSVVDDQQESLLLCGYCTFGADKEDLLVRDIPDYIVLKKDQVQKYPWLSRTLEHLSAEHLSEEPVIELTVNKLTEILIIQLLKCEFAGDVPVGVVAAMRDKRIAKALTYMHKELSEPWTIESAAAEASMSRSGFHKKFTELIGISFFDYLTRIRMNRAKQLLKSSKSSIGDIGQQVGYQSELSFVKTFKKMVGETPRAFRMNSPTI